MAKKIMYISRLFTGLEVSLLSGKWKPTGVPTIYKFIESLSLSQDWDATFFFCQKDGFSEWLQEKDVSLKLKGFSKAVNILVGENYFWNIIPGSPRRALREIRHSLKLIYYYFKIKPDVVYIDHGNTLTAALFARFFSVKVVYRIMGVYPSMRNFLTGNNLKHIVFRWAYSSPFELVVCTQDGSGIESWLDVAINKQTEVVLMINGVQLNADAQNGEELKKLEIAIPKNRTTVLFLGKLEPHKGAIEFTRALITAINLKQNTFFGVIIGFGSEKKTILELLKHEKLLDHFYFIERLPHSQILRAQKQMDIYVSLNKLGNFSNANLEAMRVGSCIVMPLNLPPIGEDLVIKKFLPIGSYGSIPHVHDVELLGKKLVYLQENKEVREKMKTEILDFSEDFISNWQDRVQKEMNLLKDRL